ncbi:MAG TPA: PBP1A family penicillin-binding protein [Symbiobacteriaceae bacterium]|nr:PBP1A family penicillin-binding protein [Symbiobacteriaceae bacterium]
MSKWPGGKWLVAAALVLPVLVFAGFGLSVVLTPLPAPRMPEATEILDTSGARVANLFTENRVEVPVAEMPDYLLNAIVAVEDDRFFRHRGIDPLGVARAVVRNVQAGRVQEGGSTITQQLAKNMYLTHERTMARKVREAVLTMKLERTYTKREILGMYWNTIYLGSGTYGAEVASQTYFGKSVRDLTLAEAALLAGLPRSPEYYSPLNNAEAAVSRRNLVLDKMVQADFIGADEAARAKRQPLRLSSKPSQLAQLQEEAPYFVDLIKRELAERYPDVAENLYKGGYDIYTTMDLTMQRAANEAVRRAMPAAEGTLDTGAQPQVALVAMDPGTGYIKALVGGRETKVALNRALEPQQPGSAFKPFVYGAVLETRRYSAASTQLDAPAEFPGATPGKPWRPQNHGGKYSYAPAPMRTALRRSLNVVTAQWINTIKPPAVVDLAKRMGIESELADDLTLGLGSSAVTPLELTRAFAPLANGGYNVTPVAILKIVDRQGNLVAEQRPKRSRALDPGVAFIVTNLLKSVVGPGGTASTVSGYMGGRPVAGKTGTSDESRDAWFVGYTPDLVAGVWVGSDANTPSWREGGSAAAPLWATFASRALAGTRSRDWTPPAGVTGVEVCAETGRLPNSVCPTTREWFLSGTEPTEVEPEPPPPPEPEPEPAPEPVAPRTLPFWPLPWPAPVPAPAPTPTPAPDEPVAP